MSQQNNIDWHKNFDVLSISRVYLVQRLGFSTEAIAALTDEQLEAIVDVIRENILFNALMNFDEEVTFVVRAFLPISALPLEKGVEHDD